MKLLASLLCFAALAVASGPKTDERIASLEKAIEKDPSRLQLKTELANSFMQKLRETGDVGYLNRANGIVTGVLSLDPGFMPAKRLLTQVEMNLHRFPQVKEYATAMLYADPSDSEMLGLLGDAQMELGEYEQAGKTYERMLSLGANLFSYNRMAYHEFVTGHADRALAWMGQAIAAGSPQPENVAWCAYDMGNMLFKTGHVDDAERAYQYALKMFPGYHRAQAGLAQVLASRSDWKTAIQHMQAAQAVVPLPEYAGALELYYEKTGRAKEAAQQRDYLAVVETLMAVNGEKANRTLALIYADQNRNLPHALDLARAEFEVRDDVYSYDALSWLLFKNGRLDEARKASEKALALGTPEPSFYFHAGMIAHSADYLKRAIGLNPAFDPRNAEVASSALTSLQDK